MPVLGRKPSTRDERRAATEAEILRATEELLGAGESYADLSVERIAAAAGISRTAFYDYFRDKRELLIRLMDAAAAPIVREADELVGGRPSGPESIPFTIRAAMAFARQRREVFRAVVEAAAYDEVVAAWYRERFVDRFVEAIERRVASQQARGAALAIPPRAAAIALVSMVTQTLYHHVTGKDDVSDDELVETIVTIAVRAVYGADAEGV